MMIFFCFFCLLQSVLPEIIRTIGVANKDQIQFVEHLRKFRILRALKMVSKFRSIRLIVLTVSKAFKVEEHFSYRTIISDS